MIGAQRGPIGTLAAGCGSVSSRPPHAPLDEEREHGTREGEVAEGRPRRAPKADRVRPPSDPGGPERPLRTSRPVSPPARVLLVNTNREAHVFTVMPAGLCAVAEATERAGHDVRVADLRFERRPQEALRRAIRTQRPDVIGLSVRNLDSGASWEPVFYLPEIRDTIVRACREESPAPIIAGGPAISVGGVAAVGFLGVDFGIAGEGEEAFPALVGRIVRGEGTEGVPGLLRPGDPPVSVRPAARLGAAREAGPADPGRWVDARAYRRAGATHPVLTKRGCPFGCVYCPYPGIEGSELRLRSPEAVAHDVAAAAARGARRFDFVDSVFGVPEDHAVAVCEAIRSAHVPVSFDVSGLNPLGTTPRLLGALRGIGVRAVLCTPDSFSGRMLGHLRKGFGPAALARAVGLLRGGGVDVCWFLVLGGPGETEGSVAETLAAVEREIPPDHVVIANLGLRVYPGTPLARLCRERGLVTGDDPLLQPTWFLEPDLDRQALLEDLAAWASRRPNVVFMGEAPRRAWARRALQSVLRILAGRRPAWAALPRLFSFLARVRDRGAVVRAGPTVGPGVRWVCRVDSRGAAGTPPAGAPKPTCPGGVGQGTEVVAPGNSCP